MSGCTGKLCRSSPRAAARSLLGVSVRYQPHVSYSSLCGSKSCVDSAARSEPLNQTSSSFQLQCRRTRIRAGRGQLQRSWLQRPHSDIVAPTLGERYATKGGWTARCLRVIADGLGTLSHIVPPLKRAAATLQGPLLLGIAYYLGAEAAFFIGTLSDRIFAPFWPPNIVLFCFLVFVPRRRWGTYVAAAIPGHVVAELGAACRRRSSSSRLQAIAW